MKIRTVKSIIFLSLLYIYSFMISEMKMIIFIFTWIHIFNKIKLRKQNPSTNKIKNKFLSIDCY